MTSSTSPDALDQLASDLRGDLLVPGSEHYRELATPWNLSVPSRPAAVAAVADAGDVQSVVRWATERRIRIAVRGTGHGALDPLDDTVLVHTGRLDGIAIDASGTARAGAGVTAGRLAAAAAGAGFAPVLGSAPTVGIAGLLTGGGIGPLARTLGVSSDRVRAFELVTGDGELRRVTADDEPELFWGLRGGKGALGIVTAIELDLLPDARILAGSLSFDGADAAAVVTAWSRWCGALPAHATTSIALMRLPDLPVIAAPIAGRLTVAVRFAWTGEESAGRAALADLLAVATPVFGGVQPMPMSGVGVIHQDPTQPTPSGEHAIMLREFPPEAADALLAVAGPDTDCALLAVELRQLGGAVATPSRGEDAFAARNVAFTANAIGIAAGPPAAATARDGARVVSALAPWAAGVRMPNFEPSDEPEAVRAAYGDRLGRLAALVERFDPHRVIAAADPIRAAASPADAP